MKFTRLLIALLLLTLAAFGSEAIAPATDPAAPKPKHFLIVLRLPERLHDQNAWTKSDHAAVSAHFQRLKAAAAEGKVLLAGKTDEPLDRTMGLVIFTAPDEASAREFMHGDPCVAQGVMTATLHPYGLAMMAR